MCGKCELGRWRCRWLSSSDRTGTWIRHALGNDDRVLQRSDYLYGFHNARSPGAGNGRTPATATECSERWRWTCHEFGVLECSARFQREKARRMCALLYQRSLAAITGSIRSFFQLLSSINSSTCCHVLISVWHFLVVFCCASRWHKSDCWTFFWGSVHVRVDGRRLPSGARPRRGGP